MLEFDLFHEVQNPTFSVVDRIYQYLNNTGQQLDEALAEAAGEACKRGLIRQIMEERGDPEPGSIRASNSGPCSRKMAYAWLGFPHQGKEIDARAKLTFLTGDLLEVVVVALIKLAGIKVRATCLDDGGQEDILFRVSNDIVVPGHSDGIIEIQDGLDEEMLLEVKSTSQWAFDNKFCKGVIDDGYRLQHNVYLDGLGFNRGIFVAIDKNSGALTEVHTVKDPEAVEWAKANHMSATQSTPDCLPPRYHDGDAYGIKYKKGVAYLAPLCSYCNQRDRCWPFTQLEFDRYGKPQYRVLEVPEDFDFAQAA